MGRRQTCSYPIAAYNLGGSYTHLFDFMPENPDRRQVAFATCQFTFQAPNSVGRDARNWGKWIRTRIYTGGEAPDISKAWQKQGEWICGDSHEAANAILNRFGLNADEVFENLNVGFCGKTTISLVDILRRFCSESNSPMGIC